MSHRSTLARTGLLIAAPALIALTLVVSPSVYGDPVSPPQTIAQVTKTLDVMARKDEALTEQYNAATIDVAKKQKAADAAAQSAADADAAYATARTRLQQAITAEYEGSSFSHAGALLVSTDNQNYLDTLNALSVMDAHRADVVDQADTAKAAAAAATTASAALLQQAKATQAVLVTQRTAITTSIAKFKALLATLTAQQLVAYQNRNAAPPAVIQQTLSTLAVHAGNKAAQIAVNFALAQLNKPYAFAAAGPRAYDCSGLTLAAWAAAGVQLPHFAATQYNYGTHVDESALQPGDLVFFYNPIGHVTIYIGNGLMVSAPQEGENVQIVSLAHFQSDYAGATRLT